MHITVCGLRIAYDDVGSGKSLLFLHGWGTSKENFIELREALQNEYRIIIPDLPGFGDSAMPPADWQVADYVSFVAEFLQALGVDGVYGLVVHSFGGRVAIKGLSTGLLRSEKLVLIDAAGIGHSRSARNVAYAVVAKVGKVVMRLPLLRGKYDKARQKLHEQAGSADYASAGEMQQIFLNTIHEDLREQVCELTLPTLIVWGSEDNETPLSDARFLHANIPGSTLKIIQGASHFVHNEHPKKVLQFIEEFLT